MISFPASRHAFSSALLRVTGIAVLATLPALLLFAGPPTLEPGDEQPSASTPAKLPGRVAIAQKLDTQIPLDLQFHDEYGKPVRLNDYFHKGRPVILNFMYFRCPMLCSMVLEGMTSAMSELKFNVGQDFDVLTVSIDPRDRPQTAMEMKDKYVKRYGRLSAANGWHFLTGSDTYIKSLTDAVGFQYAYDPETDQFAHGAAILVLTPEGRVSRYFYGFEYKARDLRLALAEASQGKIGGAAEQILLLCFHYDPATGKYSKNAMTFVRAGGAVGVLSLASFIFIMLRRERQASMTGNQAGTDPPDDDPALR